MTTQERLDRTIHTSRDVGLREQILLAFFLSLPSILSQLSTIVMEYIDASMVGSLGAEASASIGLVATTTWMFGGLCSAVSSGFSVQVAHLFGANRKKEANAVFRQAFVASLGIGLFLALIGVAISGPLPVWLGGNSDIVGNASAYFLVFALSMPIYVLYHLTNSMLRCSGDMKMPSIMNITICVLDVVFNFFFIFPQRDIEIGSLHLACPGLGLGVLGAALGTLAAWMVGFTCLMVYVSVWSKELRLVLRGRLLPDRQVVRQAFKIGTPIGMERVISCGAQIVSTIIVAPLGTVAIAANSFGITIESLCYMPGYGIGDAATTMVGQSVGAGREDLIRRFSLITLWMGIGVMTLLAVVMYVAAPELMSLMTPNLEVQQLTSTVLRIEAFAEPLFATSIICYSVFVGMGRTMGPSILNLSSIWLVRIPLAALLAASYGLIGVWIAMAFELCVRGLVLLFRLLPRLKIIHNA